MAATNQVLSTYELLEQIMLELPVADVFVLQRVSKSWQKMLQDSHPLRRKTFLLASHPVVTPKTQMEYEKLKDWSPRYGSFLELNPACHPVTLYDRHIMQCINLSYFVDEALVNDAFVHDLLHVDINLTVAVSVADLGTANLRANLQYSWKDTLLTNPPSSYALLSLTKYDSQLFDDDTECVIVDPAGVKLGLAVDIAKRMLLDSIRYGCKDSRGDVPDLDVPYSFTLAFQMKKAAADVMEHQPYTVPVHNGYDSCDYPDYYLDRDWYFDDEYYLSDDDEIYD